MNKFYQIEFLLFELILIFTFKNAFNTKRTCMYTTALQFLEQRQKHPLRRVVDLYGDVLVDLQCHMLIVELKCL